MKDRKAKQREAAARYRLKHQEKLLVAMKAYRQANRAYFNEKKTINYHENKEKFKTIFRVHYCKRRSGEFWESHKLALELQECLIGKPLTHKRTKGLKYDY